MWFNIWAGVLFLATSVYSNVIAERQSCSSDFQICAPQGAKTFSLGSFNASWDNLFNDIVSIVSGFSLNNPTVTSVDPNGPARRETELDVAFCCSDVADCLLVPGYLIPMCWDRFTTNVYFPDGTYGTVVTGDFNNSNGDTINLIYGDYELKNGVTGNIYAGQSASSAKPVTTTMPMPKQWTSTGQGSAIPATGLGATGVLSTIITVVPAITLAPSTGESITILASNTGCNHCPAYNTTIPGLTQPAITLSASTSLSTVGIISPTPPSEGNPTHTGGPRMTVLKTLVAMFLFHGIWTL